MIGIVCAFSIRKVRGFTVVANFGYSSRGSADPRESLRKRRISKLALSAHKVLPPPWCRRPLPGSGFCVGEG